MKRIALALIFTLMPGVGMAAPAPAVEDPVLVSVDGENVTLQDLDVELAAFQAVRSKSPGTILPDAESVLSRLIQNRLLEQEGYRIGADEYPHIQNQVRDYLRIKSVVALMDSVSAEAAKLGAAHLDSLMNRRNLMRRYAHILVSDENLAQALRDSLDAGAEFDALARRHSTDGTAAVGGDLGWKAEGAYLEPFERAARELAPGELAGPVKTDFGWHVITLLEERAETFGQSEAMREAMHEAAERENRMAEVRRYVLGLREKHGAVINDSLLATCDFGSNDQEVIDGMKRSNAVLAVLPTGRLTVQSLYRQILFKYFHGLSGREDAAAKRDQVFREWVDEALLSFEAKSLGIHERPELQARAERVERELLREEVLKTLLELEFSPDEAEVEAYYEAHALDFADPPRLKLHSILVDGEAAARRIHGQLEQGVQFRWLADRDPKVIAGDPPLGEDWLARSDLPPGLHAADAESGQILGPIPYEENWLLARVGAVEPVRAKPLMECRADVIAAMRRVENRKVMRSAMARLEEAAEIEIGSDALARIDERLQAIPAEDADAEAGAGPSED